MICCSETHFGNMDQFRTDSLSLIRSARATPVVRRAGLGRVKTVPSVKPEHNPTRAAVTATSIVLGGRRGGRRRSCDFGVDVAAGLASNLVLERVVTAVYESVLAKRHAPRAPRTSALDWHDRCPFARPRCRSNTHSGTGQIIDCNRGAQTVVQRLWAFSVAHARLGGRFHFGDQISKGKDPLGVAYVQAFDHATVYGYDAVPRCLSLLVCRDDLAGIG